ncbi:MAG: glycoside hydrolase family 38 C-terminal domain-containing protein [Actinomycetia bacterium]|nr:glycoside hydrolase family 38 C-terminal domain-containing protein [Actinomycetes bacterium]
MHTSLSSLPTRVARAHGRVKAAVYSHRTPARLEAHHLPGEPVPFAEATAADFTPFSVGEPWGKGWSTSWFKVSATLPADAEGRWELVVDPGFSSDSTGFQAEALAWTTEGRVIKGIHPDNRYLPVPGEIRPGDTWTLYLEAASNPAIHHPGQTAYSDLDTTPPNPIYSFRCCDLARLEEEVFALDLDLAVLNELQGELPAGSPRKAQILTGLARALDELDLRSDQGIIATAAAARAVLAPLLAQPAHAGEHQVSAVGHAHIDSAWLWPLRETVRKCARSFANVTQLAEDYPDAVFACSQMVQYAWVRDRYPDLWERVRAAVAAGSFVPVGGMWVECDGNLPGGEAMVRQLTYGKRLLADELGVTTRGVWLPDTFGYSGALPQICRLAESDWFMSQKMSWNATNVFPHHTFWWEGIDGSRVFTHFPPSDTYNSGVYGGEVHRCAASFKDSGPANRSLLAFGWGDGGGGPTREMIERARRLADLEGSPKVTIEPPDAFFAKAQAEYPQAPVWVGEMYLEFHRGTYTTHVANKQGNRRCEHLLVEAEMWWASAALQTGADYPYDEIDQIWREVLLEQFHDILPGSSIRWVHRESKEHYADLVNRLEALIGRALEALAGGSPAAAPAGPVLANPAPHPRHGVPAFGAGVARLPEPAPVVAAAGTYTLDNGLLRVTVAADGTVSSVVDLACGRELVPAGARANLLQLHPDHPNQYEAWDLDDFYRNRAEDLTGLDEIRAEADEVVVTRSFEQSRVTQRLRLEPGEPRLDIRTEVDWHQRERLLKLAFPLDLHAVEARSEIQFGYVTRPTHQNTTWDAAKFETAAQRWVHVSEGSYGVAVLNRGTYGHDISHPAQGESRGGLPTTVRLSLVRGPLYPDPRADEGQHVFETSLLVGSTADATRHGYALALPEHPVPGAGWQPLVTSSNPDVVVSAVKLADDRSGDLVVRMYESAGGRAVTDLHLGVDASDIQVVNLLERTDGVSETLATLEPVDGGVRVQLKPFQIVTVRVRG